MANIMVRRGNGGEMQAPGTAAGAWDPFRMMRELMRWDPFQEMMRMRGFEESAGGAFMPAFEVKETKDAFVFKADLPGVKEEDLEITSAQNRLTISGKREAEQQEQSENFFVYERSYGTFARSFTVPSGADLDNVKAELKHGVLTLVMPKRPESQPKKISLKSGPDKPKS